MLILVFYYQLTVEDTCHIRNLQIHSVFNRRLYIINIYLFFSHYTGGDNYHVSSNNLVNLPHCRNVDKMMEFFQSAGHHCHSIHHIFQTMKQKWNCKTTKESYFNVKICGIFLSSKNISTNSLFKHTLPSGFVVFVCRMTAFEDGCDFFLPDLYKNSKTNSD